MQKTLLTNAPSIEERSKKAKSSRRGQGASGRLHRTEAGDWVWSSDEDDSLEKDIPVTDNYIPTDNNSSPKHNHLTDDKNSEIVTNIESLGSPMTTEPQPDVSVVSNPINLVLRIRNAKKELNDIRFEFTVDKGLHFYHILTILSFGDQL